MKLHYLFPALLLAGCASSHPTAVNVGQGPLPQKHDVSDPASIRKPEQVKAYPVGRYEDPNDPDVMHEGHTVYRAETSPDWNTDPNEPTSLPLGPGEMTIADSAQEHTALTAELEQRLKQEDQLLQTTYEQNERLAEEIKSLQDGQPHVRLPMPDSRPVQESPLASPEPQPKANPASAPSSLIPPPGTRNWWQWLWPNLSTSTSNPKGN